MTDFVTLDVIFERTLLYDMSDLVTFYRTPIYVLQKEFQDSFYTLKKQFVKKSRLLGTFSLSTGVNVVRSDSKSTPEIPVRSSCNGLCEPQSEQASEPASYRLTDTKIFLLKLSQNVIKHRENINKKFKKNFLRDFNTSVAFPSENKTALSPGHQIQQKTVGNYKYLGGFVPA